MKRFLFGAVIVGAMTGRMLAQTHSPETVVVVSCGSSVLSPLSWGFDSACGRPPWDTYFPYAGYACDPYYAGWGRTYNAPTSSIAIRQPVAPEPPAPPPLPPPAPAVVLQVHEYHWPSSGSGSGMTGYSIVSKDGRVEFATVVWVQDDALCYVKLDGDDGRAPLIFY